MPSYCSSPFGHLDRPTTLGIWPAALIAAGFLVALAGADWPDHRIPYENEVRQFVWLRGKRLVSYSRRFWRADITVVLGSVELTFARRGLPTVR